MRLDKNQLFQYVLDLSGYGKIKIHRFTKWTFITLGPTLFDIRTMSLNDC